MLPKQTSEKFILSSSPHAHSGASVSGIMLDVIIALLPALVCGVWFFGMKALVLALVCVASAVTTEALCRLAMKRENSIGDFSAVLTGLLLALNLPPDLPLWMAVAGSVFAIAIAKQTFGGLGYNPFNPALAGRAFMLISFTGAMTTWSAAKWAALPEAMTSATPLAFLTKPGSSATVLDAPGILQSLFVGNVNGSIGEVSALALLVGAAYLLFRRVITWHIPVSFIASVAVFAFFKHGHDLAALKAAEVHVLSGGVILGACFMATDYVTSPITAAGKLVFGIGCGILTMLIRFAPSYPEGVSFSILVMNAFTPLINRWTRPRVFGGK